MLQALLSLEFINTLPRGNWMSMALSFSTILTASVSEHRQRNSYSVFRSVIILGQFSMPRCLSKFVPKFGSFTSGWQLLIKHLPKHMFYAALYFLLLRNHYLGVLEHCLFLAHDQPYCSLFCLNIPLWVEAKLRPVQNLSAMSSLWHEIPQLPALPSAVVLRTVHTSYNEGVS